MKLRLLFFIVFIIHSSLIADSIFSKTYEGCASTKKEALYTLSGNIQSRISTSIESVVEINNNDTVQSKISSYSKASTNLSLVNIEYKNKGKVICAIVHKDDQRKNTKKLLNQALLYDINDLPVNIDSKVEKLSLWIANIQQLSFLIPIFLEDKGNKQIILNKREKLFTDIYTKSIAYSNSLFFKSCKSTLEAAKAALNKKLFLSKQREENKGFLSSLTSFLSTDNTHEILDIFDEQLISLKKDGKECVMLKKEELLDISKNMYADMRRISQKSLSKNPKKKYKEIDNLFEQLEITKILIKLYPSYYKSNSFKQLDEVKKRLNTLKETTYPQFVIFKLSDAEKISIILDNKEIKNNEKRYLQNGNHTYKITAKGKCSIIESFNNNLFEDTTVAKDMESQKYPTVVFVTDKEPHIIVNGKVIKANVVASVQECEDESRYVVKYAGQTISGTIDTNPGDTNTVELNFLTAEELQVFNDAKSKHFSTMSGEVFLESLTTVNSDNFEFSIIRKPSHGSLTLHKSGSFEYISEKGFAGIDNFQYEIEIPQKTSAPKLVSIRVKNSTIPQNKANINVKPNKKRTVSYEEFKRFVQSKKLTKEFLQKVQKRFPKYFERLKNEMTSN